MVFSVGFNTKKFFAMWSHYTKSWLLALFVLVAICSTFQVSNRKLQRIDSIWEHGRGVLCLQINHNVSDDEAFVREAALIEAIKLENLTNVKVIAVHFLFYEFPYPFLKQARQSKKLIH